ncbi:hypothetical protein BDN72DRAFT_739909, partial [Pluteus cervinus]
FIFDSGCTRHMTPLRDQLFDYQAIPKQPIQAANSQFFSGIGVGKMRIPVPLGDR